MLSLTSTNIKLIVRDDIGNNVIIVDKNHIEELRDLLNDYLEMDKEGELCL